MKSGSRTLRFIGIAALVPTLLIGAVVLWFARAGMVEVQVEERHGDQIRMRVPAALVELTCACVPRSVVACRGHGGGNTPTQEIGPMLRAIQKGLAEAEDGVLVDVRSADETVRIAKEGRRITVNALTPDESVYLAMPIRTIGTVVGKLEAGSIHM